MIELDVQTRRKGVEPRDAERPFRILILGDFGGETGRPIRIDRDNFDGVLRKLHVNLTMPVAGKIEFHELDDFHPDRLYGRLELFRALKEARERLEDPATFQRTAAQLRPPASTPRPPADLLSSGSLLDQVVAGPGASADPFAAYLQQLVAPYSTPRPDPRQADLIAQVDAATAGQMRALLHYPAYQAIEAAWRGLFFLVRAVETGVDLQIHLVDLPKAALAQDLLTTRDLRTTVLYKLLVEQTVETPGANRWAVVAGNYTFGSNDTDIELLGRIALLTARAGAPFLAAGTPDPAAWSTLPPVWAELQQIPEVRYLGLALPRFLLRLPYGKKTESIEAFDFEEIPNGSNRGDYLWGSPTFACLFLLAETFRQEGWAMVPGQFLDIHGMPVHVYPEDGESKIQPCVEIPMTHAVAESLMERGLMPLVWMKDTDQVRLTGFRAINGSVLAGPWG